MNTRVRDRYPVEVHQENKRLMGLSNSVLKPYAESPARLLPREKGLRGLARARKVR